MTVETATTRWTPVMSASLLIGALLLGHFLRTRLGIAPSVGAVREWADNLGWSAPAAFLGLVTARQIFMLPAVLLLTAGGVIFGGLLGTALGGTGIIVSALGNFALARRFGPVVFPAGLAERVRRWSARDQASIIVFVALVTLHPLGPMVTGQWTAGCSTLRPMRFLAVVAPTSYARAGMLATFGAALPDWKSPEAIALTLLLALVIVLPLASPTLRRRLSEPPPR